MDKISVEYQVTVSDFRKATYFGLFQQHRTALRIMFVVVIVGILYAMGASLGLGTLNPLVLFIAAAYLIWGLLLFAGAEKGIRAYMQSPDCLIGCTYRAELESHRVRFEIPERKIQVTAQMNQLACVFELSALFMIYTSMQDVYLLPTRCLTPEQRIALRNNFRQRLGNNFGSRFK